MTSIEDQEKHAAYIRHCINGLCREKSALLSPSPRSPLPLPNLHNDPNLVASGTIYQSPHAEASPHSYITALTDPIPVPPKTSHADDAFIDYKSDDIDLNQPLHHKQPYNSRNVVAVLGHKSPPHPFPPANMESNSVGQSEVVRLTTFDNEEDQDYGKADDITTTIPTQATTFRTPTPGYSRNGQDIQDGSRPRDHQPQQQPIHDTTLFTATPQAAPNGYSAPHHQPTSSEQTTTTNPSEPARPNMRSGSGPISTHSASSTTSTRSGYQLMSPYVHMVPVTDVSFTYDPHRTPFDLQSIFSQHGTQNDSVRAKSRINPAEQQDTVNPTPKQPQQRQQPFQQRYQPFQEQEELIQPPHQQEHEQEHHHHQQQQQQQQQQQIQHQRQQCQEQCHQQYQHHRELAPTHQQCPQDTMAHHQDVPVETLNRVLSCLSVRVDQSNEQSKHAERQERVKRDQHERIHHHNDQYSDAVHPSQNLPSNQTPLRCREDHLAQQLPQQLPQHQQDIQLPTHHSSRDETTVPLSPHPPLLSQSSLAAIQNNARQCEHNLNDIGHHIANDL